MNTTSTQVATVEVKHVSKSYETPSSTIEVLNNISFSLSAGNSLAILGPSGTGKSTLLHLLGTLDRPDSGSIQIDGVLHEFTSIKGVREDVTDIVLNVKSLALKCR